MAKCYRNLFILSFTILIYTSLSESAQCPAEFENVCQCGYVPYGPTRKLTYVTNCTNTGFDNTMMLRRLPPDTEVLIFVGNEVKDLPLNIFGQDIVYEKLHTIDLSNNHIQTIKGRTFHNVGNVTKLILNDNDLYIVSKDHHPRMFSNFVNLKELHLRNAFTEKVKASDYVSNLAEIFENSTLNNLKVLNMENNEISRFYRGSPFCSLTALEELYLGDNHLTDLPFDLSCLKHLRVLDVGNNLIPHISAAGLFNLERIRKHENFMINFTANPFKCDCDIIRTLLWISEIPMNIVNRKSIYCVDGFPSLIGRTFISVRVNELDCPPEFDGVYPRAWFAIVTFLTSFVVLLALCALVYRNKECVITSWRKMSYPINSKFHYVSLDRKSTMDV